MSLWDAGKKPSWDRRRLIMECLKEAPNVGKGRDQGGLEGIGMGGKKKGKKRIKGVDHM